MPNQLDANGLQVATADEETLALQTGLKDIYGQDINVASSSPDGQNIGIFVQACQDILDLLVAIYNMFSVESCYGVLLQQLVALNGITPQEGTYTTTPVDITADRALTLPGLDQSTATPFQVKDSNNTWTLVSSYSFAGAGTQALIFQCTVMGAVTPLPNTITIQGTPTLGVTVVNNPTVTGTVEGQLEETDVSIRMRHGKSFKLAATGPADAVEAALLSLTGVTDAIVAENDTGSPIGSQPAHSIWCGVVGGAAADIAQAIYSKKGPGCYSYGGISEIIVRENGQPATMRYDVGVAERLYVQFGVLPTVTGLVFDKVLLAQQLAAAMTTNGQSYWKMSQQATIGDIVRAMYIIEPRAIVTGAGVSDDGATYGDNVSPTSTIYYFTLAVGDIAIS